MNLKKQSNGKISKKLYSYGYCRPTIFWGYNLLRTEQWSQAPEGATQTSCGPGEPLTSEHYDGKVISRRKSDVLSEIVEMI